METTGVIAVNWPAWLNKTLQRLRCDLRELTVVKYITDSSQRLKQRLEVREKRIYQFNLIEL